MSDCWKGSSATKGLTDLQQRTRVLDRPDALVLEVDRMNPRTSFGAADARAASLDKVRETPRCTCATLPVSEGTKNATGLDLMNKGRSLGPVFLNGLCALSFPQ